MALFLNHSTYSLMKEIISNRSIGNKEYLQMIDNLCDKTDDYKNRQEIKAFVIKKLNLPSEKWIKIYKTLKMLTYIIKGGSMDFIQELKYEIERFEVLSNCKYTCNGVENIKEKALFIFKALGSDQMIKNERMKYKVERQKEMKAEQIAEGGLLNSIGSFTFDNKKEGTKGNKYDLTKPRKNESDSDEDSDSDDNEDSNSDEEDKRKAKAKMMDNKEKNYRKSKNIVNQRNIMSSSNNSNNNENLLVFNTFNQTRPDAEKSNEQANVFDLLSFSNTTPVLNNNNNSNGNINNDLFSLTLQPNSSSNNMDLFPLSPPNTIITNNYPNNNNNDNINLLDLNNIFNISATNTTSHHNINMNNPFIYPITTSTTTNKNNNFESSSPSSLFPSLSNTSQQQQPQQPPLQQQQQPNLFDFLQF